jgi:hypothetical protein
MRRSTRLDARLRPGGLAHVPEAHDGAARRTIANLVRPLTTAWCTRLPPDVEVLSPDDLAPIFDRLARLLDCVMVVAALFVYLRVGLGITNTVLMSVRERTPEFGILQAIAAASTTARPATASQLPSGRPAGSSACDMMVVTRCAST